jgi:hypothetical protein
MRVDELEREILELPPADKARLLHELLRSLDDVAEVEIEAIWLDEAVRRNADMERTGDEGIDGSEALLRIRSRLRAS